MTEIDAVNKMLRYVGELPVPSSVIIGDLPDGHEAKDAQLILGELNRELQEKGWWFNSEDWTFPEVSGYITIPSIAISVRSTNKNDKYLVKGNQLYDVAGQTKIFTNDITLATVFEEKFTELPDIFATYVMYASARQLHTFLNGDSTVQRDLIDILNKQLIKVDKEDMSHKSYNLIKGSRVINRTTNPTPLS